jgi:Carboxylesterase family
MHAVFSPDLNGKRPVMAWFHGGAYVTGGGEESWYDASRLADEGVLEDEFAAFADLAELIQYRGALRGVEATRRSRSQAMARTTCSKSRRLRHAT